MKNNLKYFLTITTLSAFLFSFHNFYNSSLINNNDKSTTSKKNFQKITQNLPDDVNVSSILNYNDELFVGTLKKGLFERTTGSDIFVKVKEVPIAFDIRHIYDDINKNIWVCTWGGGLWEKMAETSKFIQIPETVGMRITSFFCDSNGDLHVSTWNNGLLEKKVGEDSFARDSSLAPGIINIQYITQDNLGTLWVGSLAAGLYTKKESEEKYVNLSDQGLLSSSRIESIYLDKQNNLWVGTNKNGLWKKTSGNENFLQVQRFPTDSLVNTILQDFEGNLWVGTGINTDNIGAFGLYESKDNDIFSKISSGLPNDAKFNSITEDSENKLYVGAYNYGLYEYVDNSHVGSSFPIEIVIGVTLGTIGFIIIIIAIDSLTYNKMGLRRFFKKK